MKNDAAIVEEGSRGFRRREGLREWEWDGKGRAWVWKVLPVTGWCAVIVPLVSVCLVRDFRVLFALSYHRSVYFFETDQ